MSEIFEGRAARWLPGALSGLVPRGERSRTRTKENKEMRGKENAVGRNQCNRRSETEEQLNTMNKTE